MTDRIVLSLTGPERVDFLQDLVSNDITGPGGLHYAALLTPQGKFLADFFVAHEADRLLIDAEADLAPGLAQRLRMYKLRRKLEIAETDLKVARGTGPVPDGGHPDPRHPALGWRRIGAEGGDDGSDWDAIRVEHMIPAAGRELIVGESFPLELGLDRAHGIDFRKGCYVGQEVTARMKHKTELKKGLARVAVAGRCAPGDPVTGLGGKPAGYVGTVAGERALVYLRYDRAGPGLSAGDARLTLERDLRGLSV